MRRGNCKSCLTSDGRCRAQIKKQGFPCCEDCLHEDEYEVVW